MPQPSKLLYSKLSYVAHRSILGMYTVERLTRTRAQALTNRPSLKSACEHMQRQQWASSWSKTITATSRSKGGDVQMSNNVMNKC